MFKQYRGAGVFEIGDWMPDMQDVQVHPDDAAAGHPRQGDMVRREGETLWLMTPEYVAANFVEV